MVLVTDEVCCLGIPLIFNRQPGPATLDTDQMEIDHSSIKVEVRVLQDKFFLR